jgi:outer membrane protein, heavy metal efflux system
MMNTRSAFNLDIITYVLLAVLLSGWYTVLAQVESNSSLTIGHNHQEDKQPEEAHTNRVKRLVSLNTLINEALENNPEIKAMARKFDMMRARIPQAKALPDPMLNIGYAGNIVPVPPFDIQKDDPASGRMIGVSQEIPFPGKRSLRGQIAESEAQAERLSFEQTKINVVAEVKEAYFDYYYITKAIEVINKTRRLLEQFTRIAEARYEVGKGVQQDVLKAQVELSKLTEQLLVLEQRRETSQARINSLLYRDLETPLNKPEELKPEDFNYTLTQLNDLATRNYPELKAQRRRIDQQQYALQLARKEFYPDFSVGFTYTNRPGMPEMYAASIGIKLPLYYWKKQHPAVTEASAGVDTESERFKSMRAMLFFKIKDKFLEQTTAQRLVRLYGSTIIPQSTLSLESALSGYEVGRVDFLTLIDSLVTLLNYELSYYEQLSNEEKAVSALEPLVGGYLRD